MGLIGQIGRIGLRKGKRERVKRGIMIKKQDIEFVEVSRPIRELVTKFGGQPVWVERPQWPLSRSTNQPMQFICQIKLEPEIFGEIAAKMAYLFMTSDDLSNETWQHDGGENAVILQPGQTTVPCLPNAEGPALFKMVSRFWSKTRKPKPCEYAVRLTSSSDTIQTEWETPEQEDAYGNSLI
jgi:hypothetical protein